MKGSADGRSIRSNRAVWAVCVAISMLVLVSVANVHLVYVAISSQPPCVEHERTIDDVGGTFRAAKSGC